MPVERPEPRIEVRRGGEGELFVVLGGTLDVRTAGAARRELARTLLRERATTLSVDASDLADADLAGVSLLWELIHGRLVPAVPATVSGLRPDVAELLAKYPAPAEVDEVVAADEGPAGIHAVGAGAIEVASGFREGAELLGAVTAALASIARKPSRMRWAEVGRIFESAGVAAFPVITFVGFLTGLIIAFEAAQPLKLLGAEAFVADTIGIIVLRELGPLMTAIVVAGRSGPALAAELGMMKVNEELNALETMGLDPVRFLVVQRVVALTLLSPVLTAYAMAVGVLGGVIVMVTLGFPVAVTWSQLQGAVGAHDVLVGISKGFVFGNLVAGLSCLRGLQARLGPTAVGEATTRAVVSSILAVFVADGLFAVLTYVLGI
jgi:phospholipid/cholesterol/gamma-HCH transport system permease protein